MVLIVTELNMKTVLYYVNKVLIAVLQSVGQRASSYVH